MVGKNLHPYLLHVLGSVSLTLAVSSTDYWAPLSLRRHMGIKGANKFSAFVLPEKVTSGVQDIFNLVLLRGDDQSRGEKCAEFMRNALGASHTYTWTCIPCYAGISPSDGQGSW